MLIELYPDRAALNVVEDGESRTIDIEVGTDRYDLARYVPATYETDGAVIIDTSIVHGVEEIARLAPLPDLTLDAGDVSTIDLECDPDLVAAFIATAHGVSILDAREIMDDQMAAHDAGLLGALDEVALDVYVRWWRAHGARVGVYTRGRNGRPGRVAWEPLPAVAVA